ncbi:hypothetical protein VTN77DRAFT_6294 [Rasamsonia byssochlamydoides]|uniref:uncharacterized protein n=1 Tax=Rasamsonia byssochlamydoides TaxID=89139 RepID=UPI0037449533
MADPKVCSSVGNAEWGDVNTILENIQIVPEDILLRISKGPLLKFIHECKDDQQVNCVWQSLLQTFSTRSIPRPQTTAACNAVTVFLEAGLSSQNARTQDIALSHQTWMAVFEVYMIRFEDAKIKPMKQVLSCLVKILRKHPDAKEADLIRVGAVNAIMPSVMLGDPRSRLKACLVALELLIRENAISPSQLMSLLYGWLVAHHERWRPLFESHCECLSIDTTHFVGPNPRCDDSDVKVKRDVLTIFNLGLLVHAKSQAYASSAGSMLALFSQKAGLECQRIPSLELLSPSTSWVSPTRHIMLENMDCLESMSNNVLHPLFACCYSGFRSFIDQLHFQSLLSGDMKDEGTVDEFTLLFSALQIAKKLGLVHEDHFSGRQGSAAKDKGEALILNSEVLGQFLLHREQSIRVSTLSLLITDPSTTKPISAAALKAIMSGLPSMHAESDAQSRGEILSLIRKLMVRLRGTQGARQGAIDDQTKDAERFLDAYVKFLEGELRPGASYQRHITALRSLSLVLNTGVDPRVKGVRILKADGDPTSWKFTLDILRPSLFRLLVDLLLDPFEEVRATSLTLLGLFPKDYSAQYSSHSSSEASGISERLTVGLAKAEAVASNTSRADHADTVARLYHAIFSLASPGSRQSPEMPWYESKGEIVNVILEKLERKLSQPGGLFSSTIKDAPLHGYVSALRYIVATPDFYLSIADSPEAANTAWRNVHDRIVTICNRIWNEVKPVLCIDSPEGHTDEAMDDLMVGPKDILSYSWRALRESSLLLHATVANMTYGPQDGENGLQRPDYEAIGVLSFIQLSELRHRGAFTAVSQTFATCCQRCGESSDPTISSLPEQWYQETVKIIGQQASKLTRRSAGLPALVTGILCSNPTGPLFQRVMSELQEMATLPATQSDNYSELSLPQVHAMNCLKDILVNTRLGPHTEPFIMPALTISAESLSSSIWAIRNCGLMLFRALMTRMCRLLPGTTFGFGGASGSEAGMRIHFQKYPGLVQLLSKLLTSADQSQDPHNENTSTETERVFPALELIGEKVPSASGDDEAQLRKLVLQQMKSKIWAVREQAARVYASLLRLMQILDEVRSLLRDNVNISSQNYMHGKVLCIRFALQRLWFSSHGYWRDHYGEMLSIIRDTFSKLFADARSPFVQAAMVDTLTDALEKSVQFGKTGETIDFLTDVFGSYNLELLLRSLMDQPETGREARAAPLLRRSLAWSMILKIIMEQNVDSPFHLSKIFFDVSATDADAARWILRRMDTTFDGLETCQKQFLGLYLSTILGDHREDVKTAASLNLARILEDALEKGLTLDLPDQWPKLGEYIRSQSREQTWSREMVESVLRLQGCLVTMQCAVPISQLESSKDAVLDLRRWAVSLRFALSEETVFTTRYAAVMSLKTFGRVLRKPGGRAETSPVFLEIYLILYDMLNDDDEELRDLAATVASWILSYSSVSPDKAVVLGALPASDRLADFLVSNYATSPFLFRETLERLLGEDAQRWNSRSKKGLVPVSTRLSEYRKESTVLFEEERQNLFIDDVREIDVWTRVLLRLEADSYDQGLVRRLFQWVSEGLGYLIDITSSGDQDGLLGWTSKREVYTLGVQVFSTAALFVKRELAVEPHLPNIKATILEKLGLLLEKGRAVSLHPQWLMRIESVLSLAR